MPKEMTHWALAKRAYQRLPSGSRLRGLIRRNWRSYLLGAVLPDSLFYLITGPGSREAFLAAEGLHDPPSSSYRPVERVLENEAGPGVSDQVLTTLLGVITHLEADAAFHPFVHFFSGSERGGPTALRQSLARHRALETYLDLHFIENFGSPRDRKTARLLGRSSIRSNTLVETMAVLFAEDGRFPIAISNRALGMNSVIQGLFVDPLARRVSHFLDRYPRLGILHWTRSFYPVRTPGRSTVFPGIYRYRNPATGECLRHTIEEIADGAVNGAVTAFFAIEAGMVAGKPLSAGLKEIQGPNLYTGRTGLQKRAMRYFDTRRDIFDIIFNRLNR